MLVDNKIIGKLAKRFMFLISFLLHGNNLQHLTFTTTFLFYSLLVYTVKFSLILVVIEKSDIFITTFNIDSLIMISSSLTEI